MGAEIDRLEVQVEAQATKANSELDKLVRKLDRVATSLAGVNSRGLATMGAGVNKLSNAMSNFSKNTRTEDFSRLARNLMAVGKVDTSEFSKVAGGVTSMAVSFDKLGTVSANSVQIADMAKNIAKFGGANVQKAITNLPKLSAALSDFMTSMSKVPSVSINVIQMTKALSGLASQGSKVGTAANTVSNAMNTQAKSAERATKSNKGLTSALGSLYQKYFWFSRGIQKTWSSVESSMDFLETVNYFEVAMRQIGDSAASAWKENGYASAEAYAESFAERAKQLTARMSGYEIDENGNASYTGMKNLGMDPDAVLNYQAVFAQVSSSIGVAEESALNFSKALAMLGADWASLRNLTFEQSWGKFASALAGQSRAVRSLGIDITNATLQEYAYKYGLEQAIQEMNQATKAQLRLLAIIDQSEVAFGDLANTIGSPANQVRMLQQNMSNLTRVIGNLFLPVVQNVLPYVNGLAIAFQNLFTWVGGLLGIKFDAINSSMGGMSDDMADLVGGAEDYEDALEGAGSAAKKLKNSLQGWHEINNITTQDSSASGSNTVGGGSPILDSAITSALADYEKAWNEAFDNMENRAQEWADKIGDYLEPLKKIINDFTIGDFFQAGKDTSALVSGIFDFVADAIDMVDWYGIGQNIGDYLAGIDWIKVFGSFGHLLWEALKAAFELYAGAFSAAPIETALISLISMPKALKAVTASKFITGIKKLTSNFKLVNSALTGNKESIAILTEQYPGLSKAVDVTRTAMSNFRFGIEYGNFFTGLNSGITTVRNNLTTMQKGAIGAAAVFGEFVLVKDAFYDLASGSDNVIESLLKIAGGAGAASAALYVAFGPAGLAVAAVTGVAAAIMGVNEAIKESYIQFAETVVFDNYGMKVGEVSGLLGNLWSDMSDTNQKTIELRDTIAGNNEKINEAAEALDGYANKIRATGGISAEEAATMSGDVNGLASALKDNLKYNTELAFNTFMNMSGDAAKQLGIDTETMTGILSAFQTRFSGITDTLQSDIDSYIAKIGSGSTLTQSELDDLDQKIRDLQDLSGTAYANQENLNRKLQEMADIDFGSTEEAVKAINDIKDLGVGMAAEAKTAYETSLLAFDEQIGAIKDAMDKEFISEEEAEQYLSVFTSAKEGLQTNYEREIGQIESQINTAYEYIGAQLDKAGAKVYEEAHNKFSTLNPLEQFFNINADRYATKNYEIGFYNSIKKPIQEAMVLVGEELAEYGINAADTFSSNMLDTWAAGSYDYETLGSDTVGGYIKGINEREDAAIEAFMRMVEVGMEATAEAQNSNSPSKEYEKLGKYAVEGYAEGISNNVHITEKAIYEWMQKSQRAVENSVMNLSSDLKFGESTVIGYNRGIENKVSTTVSAVQSWMTKAKNAITTSAMLFSGSYSRTAIIFGQNTALGYNSGVSSKASTTNTTMRNWMNAARNAIINSAMSFVGGQSAAAKLFGENTVLGYNGGVSSKQNSTIHLMDFYMQSIYNTFGGMYSSFYGIGGNAMSGLQNGLNSRRGALINTAQDIADSITRTIQSALQIHSPSRVMFELGTYTTEGFLNGIESMFPKVEANMGEFTRVTEGLYNFDASNHQPQVTSFSDQYYEIMQSDTGMEENNALLRELVQAVREGAVITVDGRELGRTVQKEAREYYDRTGKPFVTV